MMTKYGDLNKNSKSDFDSTKKAEYVDNEGFEVADKSNRSKLKQPIKFNPEPKKK